MNHDHDHNRRVPVDRRQAALPFWHPRRLRGRRGRDRRAERDGTPYLVERGSAAMLFMAIMLLLMTIVDGVITVALLDRGCEEANPIMAVLLKHGTTTFFVGKYLLTAAFLPVALIADRYRLFGTRLRVGHVMPILVGLYVILLAYQYSLWQHPNFAEDESLRPHHASARVEMKTGQILIAVIRESRARP